MKSINRLLKFQLLSYLKAGGIALGVGVVVSLIINTFFKFVLSPETLTMNETIISSGFILIIVSSVILTVNCFMCFFEDYRFATRLGMTRKTFFISNLIFFLIIALVYSLIFAGFGTYFLNNISGMEEGMEPVITEVRQSADEESIAFIEFKIDNLIYSGFLGLFPFIFALILGQLGFWLIIGYLIFALQAKSLFVIVPFVFILGNIPDTFPGISGIMGAIGLFLLSQLVIGTTINRVEERV